MLGRVSRLDKFFMQEDTGRRHKSLYFAYYVIKRHINKLEVHNVKGY